MTEREQQHQQECRQTERVLHHATAEDVLTDQRPAPPRHGQGEEDGQQRQPTPASGRRQDTEHGHDPDQVVDPGHG